MGHLTVLTMQGPVAAAHVDDGDGAAARDRTAEETHDCDSDELEALEDAAEEEGAEDDELDRIVDEAALFYPPARVGELLDELKEEGLVHFVQTHVVGKTEAEIKALLVSLGVLLPKTLREESISPGFLLSLVKSVLVRHLRQREKLAGYNTIDDAVRLIGESKRTIVLSGSGISTSVGIPDFRSKDGIYAQLQRQGRYNLADPQEMFDKDFFLQDPSCFFSFAKSIFPSNFVPSPSHRFIKLLEERGSLLRNYTQNIDTLEEAAGIERVLYCHGSFSQAACTSPGCTYKVAGSAIKPDIFEQRVPYCPRCAEADEAKRAAMRKAAMRGKSKSAREWDCDDDDEGDEGEDELRGLGVLKPCITFFGEKLSDEFDQSLLADRSQVDLLIVMGTSLKVAPVSELVGHIPHRTPVILINKTPVLHMAMDVQLLGDADAIVKYICNRLRWSLPSPEPNRSVVGGQSKADEATATPAGSTSRSSVDPDDAPEPRRVGESHFWLFPGAQAESLVSILDRRRSDDSGHSEDEGQGQVASQVSGPDEKEKRVSVDLLGDEQTRGVKREASSDDSATTKHSRHV